ncbi:MAG TPA: cupin domain-containing protein [Pseudonocardiaceae bacterium]|jgi:mannose-6-phosphate isomerase-like protein (cupin superfamily)|nr:cupin domain-containing protein [Pseudonocardiaceae bacterium]
MSLIVPTADGTVLVRADDAEVLAQGPSTIRLLADSDDTGGALSTQIVQLGRNVPGAVPHRHDSSAEMFYILDGIVDVLSGTDVVRANKGDLLVVPAGVPHAFGAACGHGAELLIVITPGVQRFEYFRHLGRIVRGELPRESLLAEQQRYDTYFLASPTWDANRAATPVEPASAE